MVYWTKGALRRNSGQKQRETSFSPLLVFCLVRILGKGFGVQSFGIFGLGGPGTLGHPPCPVMLVLSSSMLGVGSLMVIQPWRLGVDFLAVAEHRLIPGRVRGEWSRLRKKGLASIWAPASQDSSHVGNAGVGVISLRGAPLALPTFGTAQFRRFFDYGRAVRCMLPLVWVGSCILLFCMVIKGLTLMLSSLL